jgi:hypothetical protein
MKTQIDRFFSRCLSKRLGLGLFVAGFLLLWACFPSLSFRGLPCLSEEDCWNLPCLGGFCGGKLEEQPSEGFPEIIFDGGTEPRRCLPHERGQACYTASPESLGRGVCRAGVVSCSQEDLFRCSQEITPSVDICGNNLDEDCDGKIDENCDWLQSTSDTSEILSLRSHLYREQGADQIVMVGVFRGQIVQGSLSLRVLDQGIFALSYDAVTGESLQGVALPLPSSAMIQIHAISRRFLSEEAEILIAGSVQGRWMVGEQTIQAQERQAFLLSLRFSGKARLLWSAPSSACQPTQSQVDAMVLRSSDQRIFLAGTFTGRLCVGEKSLESAGGRDGFFLGLVEEQEQQGVWLEPLQSQGDIQIHTLRFNQNESLLQIAGASMRDLRLRIRGEQWLSVPAMSQAIVFFAYYNLASSSLSVPQGRPPEVFALQSRWSSQMTPPFLPRRSIQTQLVPLHPTSPCLLFREDGEAYTVEKGQAGCLESPESQEKPAEAWSLGQFRAAHDPKGWRFFAWLSSPQPLLFDAYLAQSGEDTQGAVGSSGSYLLGRFRESLQVAPALREEAASSLQASAVPRLFLARLQNDQREVPERDFNAHRQGFLWLRSLQEEGEVLEPQLLRDANGDLFIAGRFRGALKLCHLEVCHEITAQTDKMRWFLWKFRKP